MHEIALRIRLSAREPMTFGGFERLVGAVGTVGALIAWLPTPDARLALRGRGADPIRVETSAYGVAFEMLVVLDQTAPAAEHAAVSVAEMLRSATAEAQADDAFESGGVAGELDRLDRAAPRGRSTAERTLRAFLESARADVLSGRTTVRVRAASALVRLAEAGAVMIVERVEDPLADDPGARQIAFIVPDAGTVTIPDRPAPPAPADPAPTGDLSEKTQKSSGQGKHGKHGKKHDKKDRDTKKSESAPGAKKKSGKKTKK